MRLFAVVCESITPERRGCEFYCGNFTNFLRQLFRLPHMSYNFKLVSDISLLWSKCSERELKTLEVRPNSGVILVVWKCFVMMYLIILQKIVADN